MDFSSDNTVSTPATNLVKLLLLEARYNALLAVEFYNSKVSAGVNSDQAIVRARLGTWFLEHQAYLDRTSKKEEEKKKLNEIRNQLFFKKGPLEHNEILEIAQFLNKVADKLRIIKLDTRHQYDTTDIEADNKANLYA